MKKKKEQIVILGELPLVEDFASVCYSKNLQPIVLEEEQYASLPKYCLKQKKIPQCPRAAFELSNSEVQSKRNNLKKMERALNPKALIVSSSVTVTLTQQASWLKYPERLVGIAALPNLLSRHMFEVAVSTYTTRTALKEFQSIAFSLGKEISIVQDRIGMVTPRILCPIINEAFFTVMDDVAPAEQLDEAMKLGANYPFGPIQWGTKITLKQVVAVLDALFNDLHEERYRVAPLLRQMSLIF